MENKINIVEAVEAYLNKYVTFEESFYSFPVALWLLATHCWKQFDAFPYLAISARTKKAGKTTLKDCMVPVAKNGHKFSVSSASSMFRRMEESKEDFPVMFIDECEALISENHPAREFLNKGFERGEYITRSAAGGGETLKFDCYCPKVFVGIGGIYDTLKDRAIVIMMKRRSPVESAKAVRIRQSVRDGEAKELNLTVNAEIKEKRAEIQEMYEAAEMLSFLDERGEKCWTPLFIMAKIFCPERVEQLVSIAVDLEGMKDGKQLRATGTDWEAAEKDADDAEARILLLRDMISLCKGKEYLLSTDILDMLKAIPTAGWRKFRGVGLTVNDMGFLLDALNVHPKPIRIKKGAGSRDAKAATRRGYTWKDLHAAGILSGLIE
jgi:hypothetical protein